MIPKENERFISEMQNVILSILGAVVILASIGIFTVTIISPDQIVFGFLFSSIVTMILLLKFMVKIDYKIFVYFALILVYAAVIINLFFI